MPALGQSSLNNFYQSVKYRDPLLAALISEDVVCVSLYALTDMQELGQQAADRLRKRSRDLPVILHTVLDNALKELGYE